MKHLLSILTSSKEGDSHVAIPVRSLRHGFGRYVLAGHLLASALIARASVLQLDINGYPVDVELSAPLPDRFEYAVSGTAIQHADLASVIGGGYPEGWVILPPIDPVAFTPAPWSFELLASNPAIWQIDIAGDPTTAWPDAWVSIGTVTTGHDLSFPVGAMVTDARVITGPILFAPEPASLAVMAGSFAALVLRIR